MPPRGAREYLVQWPVASWSVQGARLTYGRSLLACRQRRPSTGRGPSVVPFTSDPADHPNVTVFHRNDQREKSLGGGIGTRVHRDHPRRPTSPRPGLRARRPGLQAIRNLQLDDVDLSNRRMTIAGLTRPLDKPHRLLTYRRNAGPTPDHQQTNRIEHPLG